MGIVRNISGFISIGVASERFRQIPGACEGIERRTLRGCRGGGFLLHLSTLPMS